MVVGNPDGSTLGGHVLAAYVSPTLEVMVTVDPITLPKRFDPADLALIDPALKQQQRAPRPQRQIITK
jgi:predicted DNA-binding protein with PD1-like motif